MNSKGFFIKKEEEEEVEVEEEEEEDDCDELAAMLELEMGMGDGDNDLSQLFVDSDDEKATKHPIGEKHKRKSKKGKGKRKSKGSDKGKEEMPEKEEEEEEDEGSMPKNKKKRKSKKSAGSTDGTDTKDGVELLLLDPFSEEDMSAYSESTVDKGAGRGSKSGMQKKKRKSKYLKEIEGSSYVIAATSSTNKQQQSNTSSSSSSSSWNGAAQERDIEDVSSPASSTMEGDKLPSLNRATNRGKATATQPKGFRNQNLAAMDKQTQAATALRRIKEFITTDLNGLSMPSATSKKVERVCEDLTLLEEWLREGSALYDRMNSAYTSEINRVLHTVGNKLKANPYDMRDLLVPKNDPYVN